VEERLQESYGRTELDATEAGDASSAWTTRAGFGEVLANGSNPLYLQVAQGLDFGTNDFSISIWVYRTSSAGAASGIVDALAGTGTGLQWFFNGDESIRIRLDDDAGQSVTADTTAAHLGLNTWQHLALTVDRTAQRARIYVNGVQATTPGGVNLSALIGAITPDQDVWISTLNGTSPARGRLDELTIFDRVLSTQEIADLSGGTPVLTLWPPSVPGPPGLPVAFWSFDGATVEERLRESYGRTELDATEAVDGSVWTTRAGFGEALANGSNPLYLQVAQGLDFGADDFSISIWARRTSSNGAASGIVDALSGTGTGLQWFFNGDESIRIRLDDDVGQSVTADTTAAHLGLNTWQHLALTVDRTAQRARIYVNGVQATTPGGVNLSALIGAITPDQDVWISTLNGTSPAQGMLDELAIFDRVLSAQEIADLSGGTPVLTLWPLPVPGPPVLIDPPEGLLRPGDAVSLATDPPGSSIRYTTDGSDPNETSDLYAGPITLSASGTLRARSFDGEVPGPISEGTFALVPAAPPSILLIVADDLGFNDLGCTGAASVATPRLDALARTGLRLTQYTTTGPGDLASQYAMLTGRLARRSGLPAALDAGAAGLDSREWILAEALRKAGYETGCIGAWHLGSADGSHPNDQGFVLFYGLPDRPDTAPPLVENRVVIDPAPNPTNLLETLTTRAEAFLDAQGAAPFFLLFQPPSLPALGASRLGSYGNRVEALDAAAGRLLDKLDALERTDDTLVIFLSDGGADRTPVNTPTGSNGRLKDGRGSTWEGGVRGPCMVSWPGVVPAGVSFALAWMPDLLPSLADLAGAYMPDDRPIDGTSRIAVWLGGRTRPDEEAAAFLYRHVGASYELQAVRSGMWKLHLDYINTDPENTTAEAAPLLYDLGVDPGERIDRSNEHAVKRNTLLQMATNHTAALTAGLQLPPVRPPVYGALTLQSGPFPEYTLDLTRPADSLDDHYRFEHSESLLPPDWSALDSRPFIEFLTRNPDGTETIAYRISFTNEVFTPTNHYLRFWTIRP
jgi:uncharacterized sulfatase